MCRCVPIINRNTKNINEIMKNKFIANVILFLSFLFSFANPCLTYSQEPAEKPYTLLLSGASFAASVNGWFELSCEELGIEGINRAKGGTAVADLANQMAGNSLYNAEELDEIDALVLMHAVNRDVYDESGLREKYTDYETPFDRSNYAIAFDYVIKKYKTECYNLKFNKKSKHYGKKHGKPAIIILCTDWHDGRTKYNTSVRKLAKKWGFPLVEFDKHIGFSKEMPHPVTGKQTSLLYAKDTQTINGETFGWHPLRGHDEYIQQRMSAIFIHALRNLFL